MKTHILILLSILLWSPSPAQIEFDEHKIADTQEWVGEVFASDLDGDGDLDLIGSENYTNLVWFTNTNGLGDFSEAITIDPGDDAEDIFSADLDNDGDMDVLIARGRICWFENIDGTGNFSTAKYLGQVYPNTASSVDAADLDGDGDMDVIAAFSYVDPFNFGYVRWYENDGTGNFSNGIQIGSDIFFNKVEAVDIDSDGDIDICTSSYYSPGIGGGDPEQTIKWYENIDGLGSFDSGTLISEGPEYISKMNSTDLDGDGDPDLLAIKEDYSSNSNLIIWFENIDGQGTYSPAHIIGEESGFRGIQADDIDSDGDTDVIASWDDGNLEGGILWYENIGPGTFGPKQTIIFTSDYWAGYFSIYTGDFDNDTDIDVFGGLSDKFSWYENNLILGNTEFASSQLSIFPNPAENHFTIQLDAASELERINIYNNLGQLVHSTSVPVVDSSNLSSGIYYVEVITNKGRATKKLILK